MKKKHFKSFLYFLFGFLSIIAFIVAIIINWECLFNLTSFYWLYFIFFTILLLSGIYLVIEGIHFIKAAQKGEYIDCFLYNKIITTFLLIMLIGALLFYFTYLNNKKDNIGPYLSWSDEDTSSTMTITWVTNYAEPNPIFKWGETSTDLDHRAKVEGTEYHHFVKLKDLDPDSTYYYQIPGFRNIITQFKTGPKIGSREPFSFLFYGDTRESNPSESELHHEENIELMAKERNARFVLQAGDIANEYEKNWKEQWIYNFHVIEPISKHIPYMSIAGNHDWHKITDIEKRYIFIDYYELPQNDPNKDESSYWFSYGNVFILAIGYDEEDYAAPENYDSKFVNWVSEKLQYAKNSGLFDWIFVMNHKPAFSIKIENNKMDENNTQIRYWHPVFMENGVDFVLNGHNHHYERVTMGNTLADIGSHNITYLVSGGGGGGSRLHDCEMATFDSNTNPLGDLKYYGQTNCYNISYHFVKFSVNGNTLTLTATTDIGNIIETHTFSK